MAETIHLASARELDIEKTFECGQCFRWNAGEDVRVGVSVCDSIEELASYLAQVGIPFTDDCLLVELEGTWADDEDEDAHLGARLIIPTRIVSTELAGERLIDMIMAAYDQIAA